MSTRRDFLARLTALYAAGYASFPRLAPPTQPRPLKILILGGTGFIGPHMVRAAASRGHTLTLFNRGRTNADLFPGVETLTGDRDGKLDALRGRKWDAVIDNSGYVPRHVRDSATLLAPNIGRYVFISTGSVYAMDQERYDESSPLLRAPDPASEDVNKYYGELKVLCEEAVNQLYGTRATILRLHIVAGPGDPTHRFTYWPARITRGGEVLVPGQATWPVQYIDARDLAAFTVRSVEQSLTGTFNVAAPSRPMAEFVDGIRSGIGATATFTYVDQEFLAPRNVRLPMVLHPEKGPTRGLFKVSSARALAAGLTIRPVSDTARDTLAWFKEQPAELQQAVRVDVERDAKVLSEWKARG